MKYTFRAAVKSESKPLVGLYSESGCGKTYSALLLARGFSGNGRVGMIETEGGRGEAYADMIPGGYDVLPIRGNFAPQEYGEAISAAEQANLAALIIDSASHEWEGVGGVLAIAAEAQAAGKKGPLVWQAAKLAHQRHFMGRLISTPIPLVVVCMRAKYPMQEDKARREWVRSDKLDPKQSDDILFEMFCHGWIDREHKFHGTKYTRPDWRDIIRDGEPISLETGKRLAAWSSGSGDTQSIAQPSSPKRALAAADSGSSATEPDDPRERAKVIASIKALAMKVPAADRENAKKTYGIADPQAATLSSLREYESWLRTRAGEAA